MVLATSFDPQLLELLRCPQTGQKLSVATPDAFDRLLERQKAGTLMHANGDPVSRVFKVALITEDGSRGYVVSDGIAILLISEAILL